MKICGIIAEYNPFHNGHTYHIEETKKQTNCDAVIAIMSGNFIQRGLPALFDKWTRAKMAIKNGVDIVIELPTCYATSSAEFFANGAIGILNKLNCIDYLSFGSQTNDINILKKIAKVLYEEPDEYKLFLQKELKKGVSFPVARCNSLKNYFKKDFSENMLEDILLDSNNILGIEYLKSLLAYNSSITPIAIKRIGPDYNSTNITDKYASATAIRETLKNNDFSKLPNVVPENVFNIITDECTLGKAPMFMNNFEHEILYLLRKLSNYELSDISDVSEGLQNVLKKASMESFNIDELISNIKSKRYTQTRIQRILIHILLGIKTAFINKNKLTPQYAHILAFSKNGKKIISELSKNAEIPIVTSVNKFLKKASASQIDMMNLDILATNIYTLGYQMPDFKKVNLDYTKQIEE